MITLLVSFLFFSDSAVAKDVFFDGEKDRFVQTTLFIEDAEIVILYEACQIQDFKKGTGICREFLTIPQNQFWQMQACLGAEGVVAGTEVVIGGGVSALIAALLFETGWGPIVFGAIAYKAVTHGSSTISENLELAPIFRNAAATDRDHLSSAKFENYFLNLMKVTDWAFFSCDLKNEKKPSSLTRSVQFTQVQIDSVLDAQAGNYR